MAGIAVKEPVIPAYIVCQVKKHRGVLNLIKNSFGINKILLLTQRVLGSFLSEKRL
jgi:hypothetical protein